MKHLFFLLAPIFFLLAGQAQGDNFSQEKVKPAEVLINYPLDYKSIKIIDARFDTTKIGYVKSGKQFKKIVTEGSLSVALENHLNNQLKKQLNESAKQNLLIIIKKLWLQQTNTDELDDKKKLRTYASAEGEFGMCTSAFDVYLEKDSFYIPLLRIDTSLFTLKQLNKHAGYLLGFALQNCINRIGSIEPNKINNRRLLSWPDIVQYNNKRLAYPRYMNDPLVQGIFLTFKDFLDNKPTIRKFVV